jgi:hypothetical protein
MELHAMKRLISLLLGLSLAACGLGGPAATPDAAGAVITLERAACFGTCPIYKLTLHGDGRVEYLGGQYVAVIGPRTGAISPAQVQELLAAFNRAGYARLADAYTAPATDLPSTITSLTLNGQTKTVNNYGGCVIDFPGKAPQALCDLETQIDTVTQSAQWVAGP